MGNRLGLGRRFDVRGNALLEEDVQFSARLRLGCARLQSAHHHQPPVITLLEDRGGLRARLSPLARRFRRPARLDLRLRVNRQPNLDRLTRRGHTHDRKGHAVHRDRLAHGGGVAPESPLPKAVADYGNGAGSGLIVLHREGAAENRLDAERREKRSRDEVCISHFRHALETDAHLVAVGGHRQDAREDGVSGANPFISRVGERLAGPTSSRSTAHIPRKTAHDALGPPFRCPGEQNKLPRILNRQHLQQHGVNQTEDRGVGANAEGERQNSHQREAGTLRQHPCPVTQILNQCRHYPPPSFCLWGDQKGKV